MVNQTLSFEEILEREEYVLADTSIDEYRENGSGWYREFIYPANSFSDIDEEVLRKKVSDLDFFISLLRNPHVYTSPGVVSEIKNGRDIVQGKIEYLKKEDGISDFLNILFGQKIPKRNLRRRKYQESNRNGNDQRELLDEIQDLYHGSSVRARRSILRPKRRGLYDRLENLVLKVTENTHSKIDFSLRYGELINGDKKDFHTDEQLVSLALYLSMEGSRGCIISGDSDFGRILINTFRYLSDPNASYSQDSLLDSIKENWVRFYYNSSKEVGTLVLDTFEPISMTRLSSEEVRRINLALVT